MNQSHSLSRRDFLGRSTKATALGLLASGLPAGWVGSAHASDAPETANVNFGIIALTDCSPIVIAHEKGLFKKYGITSTVTKGASWAAIRDSLANGDIQATHMLIGMPIASTMGLGGAPKVPMVVPWLMNRNGQSISLANSFKGKVGADPKALKPLVEAIFLSDRVVMMTDGPEAEVGDILSIPFERPRNRAAVLSDPRYPEIRNHLLTFLNERSHLRSSRICAPENLPSAPHLSPAPVGRGVIVDS